MNVFHTHERTSGRGGGSKPRTRFTPLMPWVGRSHVGDDRGVRFRVPYQLTRAYEEASNKQQAAAASNSKQQQAAATSSSKLTRTRTC